MSTNNSYTKRPLIYLASPYGHPEEAVRVERFRQACTAAGVLMASGHAVFSPIAHSHPIAEEGGSPGDWEFWRQQDLNFLVRCDQLMVLTLDGWQVSVGVTAERAFAAQIGIPINFVALTESGTLKLLSWEDLHVSG